MGSIVIGIGIFVASWVIGLLVSKISHIEEMQQQLHRQLSDLQDRVSNLPTEECEYSRQLRKHRRGLIDMGIDPFRQ